MSNDTQNVDGMVENFISQLVTETKMDTNMESDVLSQLKKDLSERLQDRINAVILSHIPKSKLEEFETLLDEGDASKTQAFCSRNIPNLTELVAAEFLGFRNRYIS